ncbi:MULTISPECIES: hypothetical protein [Dysgonomonas]|uniref:hypothetical protein n=1 Tax=Dysgonomonas TaxID=156973 RepID=UPI00092655B7|nr:MULTISPECIES: hypothetical protein [Dysgonomonas]MBN9303250.1 hypothetical protein [Dysgonomonas mossii]OJX60501.1 MAG: hypothetical protein BGO84_08990 [Dysgonomonas sp. 37-18]
MADKKEFTLKVNGLEQSIENVEKLNNSLDKVDVKTRGMSVTASDVADAYKDDIKDVMEYIVLQMAKIGAIVTELNAHVSKAIEKNVEAGEKLAESIEKSAESGLSSVKVKAIEASTLIEAWIDKVANRSEEQLINLQAKQTEQLEKNKELLEKSAAITKEYDEKDKEIGTLNLKAHKENTEARIGELKNYKVELEAADIQTRLYYSSVISLYAEDSAEFKQAQEGKQKALEDLRIKIAETDKELKETSSSYWNTWKKQQVEFGKEIEKLGVDIEKKTTGKIDDITEKITEKTKGVTDFINKYSKEYNDQKTEILEGLKAIDDEEKEFNDNKYKAKLAKLEKERKELRKEITDAQKNRDEAQKKKDEAEAKKAKIEEEATKKKNDYEDKIKRIKDAFELDDSDFADEVEVDSITTSGSPETNTHKAAKSLIEQPSANISETDSGEGTLPLTGEEESKSKPKPPTDDERQAAIDRIKELKKLNDEVKADTEDLATIIKDANETIENSNNAIIEGERSILLEEMQIDDEKKKLEEKKSKRNEEIDAREQKRKDKLAKIEEVAQKAKKLKEKAEAKIQAVRDIAVATKDIAKGVATAWGKGPILGPPLAALVALNGAIQLKMMTAQLAKFRDGGLLHGKRHSQGGMRIEGTNMEVEGGEFVVNRVSTDKNLGLVKYINEQRRELKPKDLDAFFSRSSQGLEPSFKRMFAQGGQLPTIEPATNVDNDSLIKAIQAIKIEPKVAVTDIHRAQDNMVSVSGWSGV